MMSVTGASGTTSAELLTHEQLVSLALEKLRSEPEFRDHVLAELYVFQHEFRTMMERMAPMLNGGILGRIFGGKKGPE